MKLLKRNTQPVWYCKYLGVENLVDEDGHRTGEKKVLYSQPVKIYSNVSSANGEVQSQVFGNIDGYEKMMVIDDPTCPIDSDTVLFVDKEPEFDERGVPMYDYKVMRVARSVSSLSVAILKVTKQ